MGRLGTRAPVADALARVKPDHFSQQRGFNDAQTAARWSVTNIAGREYEYEVIYECARRGVNLELGK